VRARRYEKVPSLPVLLEISDKVLIEGTGALDRDLLVRGLQWLLAVEDVPHLGSRVPRKSEFAGSRGIAGSHHPSCSNRKAAPRPSAARGDKEG
jgi:hypothetical protein